MNKETQWDVSVCVCGGMCALMHVQLIKLGERNILEEEIFGKDRKKAVRDLKKKIIIQKKIKTSSQNQENVFRVTQGKEKNSLITGSKANEKSQL